MNGMFAAGIALMAVIAKFRYGRLRGGGSAEDGRGDG